MKYSCIPTLNVAPQRLRLRLCNKRAVNSGTVSTVTIPEDKMVLSEDVLDDILKEAYPDNVIVCEDNTKSHLVFKAMVLIGFVLYIYFMYHMANSPDL
jgi:hypothetical protein